MIHRYHRIIINSFVFHILNNWQEKWRENFSCHLKIRENFSCHLKRQENFSHRIFFPIFKNWRENFSCQFLWWEKFSRVLLEIKVRKKNPTGKKFSRGIFDRKMTGKFFPQEFPWENFFQLPLVAIPGGTGENFFVE